MMRKMDATLESSRYNSAWMLQMLREHCDVFRDRQRAANIKSVSANRATSAANRSGSAFASVCGLF